MNNGGNKALAGEARLVELCKFSRALGTSLWPPGITRPTG